MNQKTNTEFIHVRLDERGLWTADLRNSVGVLKNLGGSYPKSQSATHDAKVSWGLDLPIKLGELADKDKGGFASLPDIKISMNALLERLERLK